MGKCIGGCAFIFDKVRMLIKNVWRPLPTGRADANEPVKLGLAPGGLSFGQAHPKFLQPQS